MSNEKSRSPYAAIAPALGEYTDKVLFGDMWKRPGLSPRDRSLVTVASLRLKGFARADPTRRRETPSPVPAGSSETHA